MVERIFEMFAFMQALLYSLWTAYIGLAKICPIAAIIIAVWFLAPVAYAIIKRCRC